MDPEVVKIMKKVNELNRDRFVNSMAESYMIKEQTVDMYETTKINGMFGNNDINEKFYCSKLKEVMGDKIAECKVIPNSYLIFVKFAK